MRLLPTLFLCLFATLATAQRCGGSHRILLHTPDRTHIDGTLQYSIDGAGTQGKSHLDTVRGDDHMLALTTRTGCGLPELRYAVRQLHTGQVMVINVYHLPGDMPSTDLLLPFTPGVHTYFDLNRITACMPFARAQDGDTIACHAGFGVVHKSDKTYDVVFEPLDLVPWQMPPNIQPYQAARAAGYSGGEHVLHSMIIGQFDRSLVERLGITATISGTAWVETDNTVHEVNLTSSGHPALEKELVRTLRALRGWQCAVAERPNYEWKPRQFHPVRAPMTFSYSISPDSIWREIPAGTMTLSPAEPTSRDSIGITLHWIGGSCGSYVGSARIATATPPGTITDLLVYFDGPLGEICTDIKRQSFTIRTGPLPPGRYRIRMDVAPGDRSAMTGLDTYDVRYFEVR